MKTKTVLVLSHAGVMGTDPFSGDLDPNASSVALKSIQQNGLTFDLVLGSPCLPVLATAGMLANKVPFEPIRMLKPDGAMMQDVTPIFKDLGMFPSPEEIGQHPLVNRFDTLAEAVGWQIDALIEARNPSSVLIIVFPPITNLVIHYLRCGENGYSESFKQVVLSDKFRACEGYLLNDVIVKGECSGSLDRRFPFQE
jgi:hypothetical protein